MRKSIYKSTAVILLSACFFTPASAQEGEGNDKIQIAVLLDTKTESNAQPEDKVFMMVDQMPQYPEGDAAMMQFLGANLKYPTEAAEAGIQGRVIIRFVVDRTGQVASPQVIRGVDPHLDKEALRVVKSMPKWKPGKQDGKEVDVYFTLPIIFRFSEPEPKEIDK